MCIIQISIIKINIEITKKELKITLGVFLSTGIKESIFNTVKSNSRIKLPKESAFIKSEAINVNSGIKIYKNDFKIYKDSVANYESDFSGITINICFNANHFYISELSDFRINPLANHTIVNYITKDKGQIFYKKDSEIKNIMIYLEPKFLKEFFRNNEKAKQSIKSIEKQKFCQSIKVKKTDLKTKVCALEIYNCLCSSAYDVLFVQGKVLEILSYELIDLFENNKDKKEQNVKFSSYDIKALYKAKEILSSNLKESPSISELSKMIKLNEFKLKYGFKNFFDTTPRNFLIENRMIKAKKLLENSELNISEVAYEVGYKQAHNLSTAFVKYYGVKPKDIIKNRKFYY